MRMTVPLFRNETICTTHEQLLTSLISHLSAFEMGDGPIPVSTIMPVG